MLTHLLLPWLPGFRLDTIAMIDRTIRLELTALYVEAACPLCSQPSRAIHSHYHRTIADLPWAQVPVRLTLHVRKFFCRNPVCPRVVFTERLPALVAPSARRTQRLLAEQQQLALDQGGEASARIAARQGMSVSPRTLLRFARRMPVSQHPTPRILGVDDFAFRKGQTYGTLLVDLQRHQPIDMLADRSAETLARWLERHPGVEIISRDRALDYAEGAARGAPQAIQVADRFHILQNVREMLQRLLERHQTSLRAAMAPDGAFQATEPPTLPRSVPDSELSSVPAHSPPAPNVLLRDDMLTPVTATPSDQRREARRAQRLARYREVRDLRGRGLSIRDIARQLRLGRQTVRRFVVADQFPERATRRTAPSKLDPYVPYLQQQLALGQDNGMQLWREIRDQQGYRGSRALVSRWVAHHRHLCPVPPTAAPPAHRRGRPAARAAGPQPTRPRTLSARQAAWLLVRRPDELEDVDRAIVERLCQVCDEVQLAYPLAQEFNRIVREQHVDALAGWLTRAHASGIPELKSFVAGIQRDRAAVMAALTLPFSNGQVEGQINRLKLIKRSGYGRAKLDLLRQQVLAA
jgi:transposase